MNPGKPLRRYPLLCLAGLIVTGAVLWISYFLANFDLDLYRDQLAEELGDRLQLPVRLGEAHLQLREGGIAFRFADLRVGTDQTSTELQARKLWLQLAWHGLLLGKPIFTEIALDTPQLRISSAVSPAAPEPASSGGFHPEMLNDLQIRRIEIQRGTLDCGWRYASGIERTLILNDLSVEISDFGPDSTAAFNATGNLSGAKGPARLDLKGSVGLPANGAWREAFWDFALQAKTLDAAQLVGWLPDAAGIGAEGAGKLALTVKGSTAGSVAFQAELTGERLRIRPRIVHEQRLPFNRLRIAGTWQQQGDTTTVRQMAVQLDELLLAGDLIVQTAANARQISGTLGNCSLPLEILRHWLPPDLAGSPGLLKNLRPGGVLNLQQAAFRAEWPADPEAHRSFSLDRLDGGATNLAWSIGQDKTAELATLGFHLANGRWQFDHGTALVAGLPLTFSGTLTAQENAAAQLDFALTGNASATRLAALWPDTWPTELTASGEMTLQGRVTGTTEQMIVQSHLDLAALDLRYGEQLHLPPTAGAALTLHGRATPTSLALDQGTLAYPPFSGLLTGSVDWSGPAAVALAAKLELADLTAAHHLIPLLGKLQLRGGAALELAADGPIAAAQMRTSLELRDVSIPTHGIVADINQLNGRLLLEGKGVRSEKLTARLGKSPVILQAQVADLQSPQLDLGVKASTIRADELIFRSDRALLHDLSGRLLIDRDGIAFMPVNVRLDGGTRASVRGTVKDFSKPRVDLDISGDYANVEEIIQLWTAESPAAETARKARAAATPHPPFPPVRITVAAKEGTLYGMKFQKATALIVPTPERLLFHPLNFSVGEGYCTTQVLVDFSGSHPLLRVSGHAENVDAYAVYNELLHRKSILRGTLRGDFYLQGELGKPGFLPTSYGHFNVTVRDGVMRHSPVLGTVFSLLNVSQLFSMELPDVSGEGVPFSRLTIDARLDKGILSSDDLVIDSNAMSMSYVGQADMIRDRLDLLLVVKPLGTIDKVVSNLPIAGWILGGKERALITAQFKVTGPAEQPEVEAIPISAISKGVLGIFQRTLSLPLTLVEDPAILWGGGGEKK
jgi:uncharacterized protein YhdP